MGLLSWLNRSGNEILGPTIVDPGFKRADSALETGAVAGAILVSYAKTYFTGALSDVWLYALGLLFVLVTLFLPRGIAGLLPSRFSWRSRSNGPHATDVVARQDSVS